MFNQTLSKLITINTLLEILIKSYLLNESNGQLRL